MKINPAIFREYDIRGIAEKDLSADFAGQLGLAYAKMIRGARPVAGRTHLKVSVGRDCRLTGDAYADALMNGLQEAGIDVVDLGVCPTPLTYFSIHHLNLDGGIMVTGSHNPANYNGFKICVGKDTLHGSQIQELKSLFSAGATPSVARKGERSSHEIIGDYVNYLIQSAKPLKRLKVVLDAGNGTAATVAPLLFERLGAEVIPLFCTLDGRFPNHHPDPTVVENLSDLIRTVREHRADFGVAFDGDSDRIGLVDETGRVIFGDEMMVLFSRDVLRTHPGATIISEVKSSYRLYDAIAQAGGKPLMWKTGHSLIKSKMKETSALLAGEMSGHIFFADRYFGFDDAIYAALRIFEIVSQSGGPLSRLLTDLPKTEATPEIRIDCQEGLKFELVEETKKQLEKLGQKLNTIDGVRIDFGDGWGLVRASNTQPVLVLRFESTSEARLTEIKRSVESALQTAATKIGHPPIDTSRSASH